MNVDSSGADSGERATAPTVLEEAAALINGDRAKDYGDVSENFERIAKLWGAYRGQFFDRHDVSMMMILVKVARQSNGYHRDSAVDIAGYTALGERVHDEMEYPDEYYIKVTKDSQPWRILTGEEPASKFDLYVDRLTEGLEGTE